MTFGNPFVTAADRYAAGRPYHHERTLRRALTGSFSAAVDVACGTGLSTKALAAVGIRAVGVDPARAMVERARADTGLSYVVGSAEALPVASRAVDLVTVGSGVHWFDQDAFAAEAARVLRPGGTLVLYEHAGPDLPAEPAFRDWVRETYLRRYPSPARGAMAADFDGRGRFALEDVDRWVDEVPFGLDGFAAYLLTQSNLLGAPEAPVREWLLAELAPFFPAGRPVAFTASYRRLRA